MFNRILFSLGLCLLSLSGAAHAERPLRILVLHGVWESASWESDFDRGIRAALDEFAETPNELSVQHLGYTDAMHEAYFTAYLRQLAENQIVDYLVCVLPSACQYLRRFETDRRKIYVLPGIEATDWVLSGNERILVQSGSEQAMRETLRQMLELRPALERIHVVAGTSGTDRSYLLRFKDVARSMDLIDRMTFHVGKEPGQLLEDISSVPASDGILMSSSETLGATSDFMYDSLIPNASAPIFTYFDSYIGRGATGGHITSARVYGRAAGARLASLIDGKAVTVQHDALVESVYDWQQLNRWGIDPSALPQGTRIINEPLTVWETNPRLTVLVIASLLFLVILVVIQYFYLRKIRASEAALIESHRRQEESQKRLSLHAENSRDAIWTFDIRTGHVTYCSPVIEQISGFTPDEICRLGVTDIIKLPDGEFDPNAQEDSTFEVLHLTKSGERVWCEISVEEILSPTEDATHVGVTRLITERKEAERARNDLMHQLAHVQRFESLGTFAGGIAHDFNNILQVISGLLELTRDRLNQGKPVDELLGRLDHSTQQAIGLVKQILTFSRRSKDEKSVIDLREVLHDTIDMIRPLLPKTVEFECDLPRTACCCVGNENQLEQVFVNLLTNGFQALGDERGRISVALEEVAFPAEQKFRLGDLPAGDYAAIRICDTGVGMDEEMLERVFEPFFTTKEDGNGMGLAIVYGVVLDHGGLLDVVSARGEGTTFTVYLPLRKSATTDTDAPGNREDAEPSAAMNVLLIDDQEQVLHVLERMVERLGHRYTASTLPEEGLRLIREQHFDVLISDYSMPGMNGVELAKRCRELVPDLHVILVSGYGDDVVANAGFRVLHKPYSMKDLEAALQETMAIA